MKHVKAKVMTTACAMVAIGQTVLVATSDSLHGPYAYAVLVVNYWICLYVSLSAWKDEYR